MSFYKLIVSKAIQLNSDLNHFFCLKAIEIEEKVHYSLVILFIPLKFEIPTGVDVKSLNVVSCQQQQLAVFRRKYLLQERISGVVHFIC